MTLTINIFHVNKEKSLGLPPPKFSGTTFYTPVEEKQAASVEMSRMTDNPIAPHGAHTSAKAALLAGSGDSTRSTRVQQQTGRVGEWA